MNILLIGYNRLDFIKNQLDWFDSLSISLKIFLHFDKFENGEAQEELSKSYSHKGVLCSYHITSKNLGCKYGVKHALDWFFDQVEEGVILEDDVAISLDSFNFISANKAPNTIISLFTTEQENGVTCSKYPFVWGWWTTKATIANFDVDSFSEDLVRSSKLPFFDKIWFQRVAREHARMSVNTWDHQFWYYAATNSIRTIMPRRTLAINMGFEERATHTKEIMPLWLEEVKLSSAKNWNGFTPDIGTKVFRKHMLGLSLKNKIKLLLWRILR